MKERIENVLNYQIENLEKLKNSDYIDQMLKSINIILECMKKGGKILIAGNGGSAADAQHFAAEIVGRFMLERKGYPAIALTTDTSILTAVGNDYGYDQVFSRQVEALGTKDDVFIGLSTSGNSKNVILAIEKAKKMGLKVIGMTGRDGGTMKNISDVCINMPYNESARIQEHHLMSYHLMCEFIEKELKDYYEK